MDQLVNTFVLCDNNVRFACQVICPNGQVSLCKNIETNLGSAMANKNACDMCTEYECRDCESYTIGDGILSSDKNNNQNTNNNSQGPTSTTTVQSESTPSSLTTPPGRNTPLTNNGNNTNNNNSNTSTTEKESGGVMNKLSDSTGIPNSALYIIFGGIILILLVIILFIFKRRSGKSKDSSGESTIKLARNSRNGFEPEMMYESKNDVNSKFSLYADENNNDNNNNDGSINSYSMEMNHNTNHANNNNNNSSNNNSYNHMGSRRNSYSNLSNIISGNDLMAEQGGHLKSPEGLKNNISFENNSMIHKSPLTKRESTRPLSRINTSDNGFGSPSNVSIRSMEPMSATITTAEAICNKAPIPAHINNKEILDMKLKKEKKDTNTYNNMPYISSSSPRSLNLSNSNSPMANTNNPNLYNNNNSPKKERENNYRRSNLSLLNSPSSGNNPNTTTNYHIHSPITATTTTTTATTTNPHLTQNSNSSTLNTHPVNTTTSTISTTASSSIGYSLPTLVDYMSTSGSEVKAKASTASKASNHSILYNTSKGNNTNDNTNSNTKTGYGSNDYEFTNNNNNNNSKMMKEYNYNNKTSNSSSSSTNGNAPTNYYGTTNTNGMNVNNMITDMVLTLDNSFNDSSFLRNSSFEKANSFNNNSNNNNNTMTTSNEMGQVMGSSSDSYQLPSLTNMTLSSEAAYQLPDLTFNNNSKSANENYSPNHTVKESYLNHPMNFDSSMINTSSSSISSSNHSSSGHNNNNGVGNTNFNNPYSTTTNATSNYNSSNYKINNTNTTTANFNNINANNNSTTTNISNRGSGNSNGANTNGFNRYIHGESNNYGNDDGYYSNKLASPSTPKSVNAITQLKSPSTTPKSSTLRSPKIPSTPKNNANGYAQPLYSSSPSPKPRTSVINTNFSQPMKSPSTPKSANIYAKSPSTPKSANIYSKSPSAKHQSMIVTSPTSYSTLSKTSKKRTTLTSPGISLNLSSLDSNHTPVLVKTPRTPNTPISSPLQTGLEQSSQSSIDYMPSYNNFMTNPPPPPPPHSSSSSTSTIDRRPSSKRSHVTPILDRMPSNGKKNHSTPTLDRSTLDRTPSGGKKGRSTPIMDRSTLDRTPSGGKKGRSTPIMDRSTLDRTPSGGKKGRSTPTLDRSTLDRTPSGGKKGRSTPTLDRTPSSKRRSTPVLNNIINNVNPEYPSKLSDLISIAVNDEMDEQIANTLHRRNNSNSSTTKSPVTQQPKSILRNGNSSSNTPTSVHKRNPSIGTPTSILKHSGSEEEKTKSLRKTSIKRQRSNRHQKAAQSSQNTEITVPPFPSIPRGFKSGNSYPSNDGTSNNSSNVSITTTPLNDVADSSPYSESISTTPLYPPHLTVFGHPVATPPTPKSTRFPQDSKVLPPLENSTPMPPDILGGTDTKPINTMTLQRSQFRHAKKPSLSSSITMNNLPKASNEDLSKSFNSSKSFGSIATLPRSLPSHNSSHPLPVPPGHRSNKSIGNLSGITDSHAYESTGGGTLNRNISSGSSSSRKKYLNNDDLEDSKFHRSKSLPRPSKTNNDEAKYSKYEDLLLHPKSVIANVEQQLTNFESDLLKERENQYYSKSSLISILHEEKANMDRYLLHCDD